MTVVLETDNGYTVGVAQPPDINNLSGRLIKLDLPGRK